jgi:homoserine kinase type II
LVDLALAVAGCARAEDGRLDAGRARALIDVYHARRPLTPIERGAWPTLLRAAALQLWLTTLAATAAPTRAAPFAAFLRWLTTNEKDVRALWPRAAGGRN